MSRQWTNAQNDAINAQGGSVIVSAAAGSGKTSVLVERVKNRISNPFKKVDVDKLLIVTYTKAAANEMRERISSELEVLAKSYPNEAYYRRQLILLNKANISTIHSFCGNMIKENFFMVDGIPSEYKIAEESTLTVIKNQAFENVIENLYDSNDESFRYMADCFSTAKGEYNLKSTVMNIYDFLCSQPFPEKWMNDVIKEYEENDISDSIWGKAILREASLAADFLSDKITECLLLYEERPEIGNGIQNTLLNKYKVIVDEYKKLVDEKDWNGLYAFCCRKHDFGRLTAAKGYADDIAKVRISNICGVIKDEISKKIPKLFIYNEDDYKHTTKIAAPAINTLFKTVSLFAEEYSRLKAEDNLADFSDLEHWALKLLYKDGKVTPLAESLSEHFCEVMVDEYQDANEVQDLIFNSVSDNGKKLFVVGDVKQSIYRFRQAKPELFLRRKNSYHPYDKNSDNYPAKIVLDRNFRSRSGIAETVNFIFSKLMSPQAGDMYYEKEDMLVYGASYQEDNTPDTELNMIFTPKTADISMHTAEARFIAKRIIRMKSSFKVEEHGEKRDAKFSDFAILLRNNTNAMEYVNVLKAAGIPAQSAACDNYLDTNEIQIIISLLKVINNPLSDVPLLNVLTSPIFAFTPTLLAKLRINHRHESLYASVKRAAENGDKQCVDFCNVLTDFRTASTAFTLPELLDKIYDDTSYPEIVSSTDGGQLKLNNLRLFQKYTIEYAQSGGSLSSYIRYLDKLMEQNVELKSSRVDAQTSKVKVMTIHGSKGLEFPVCFVAGISSLKHNDYSQLLMHADLGVGASINVIDGSYRYESVQKQAIKMQQDIDDVSEELRVLYVALTRAKEKLIMLASFPSGKPNETIAKISSRLDLANDTIHPYVVRSFSTSAYRLAACAILYGKNKVIADILEMPQKPFDGKSEDFWKSSVYMGQEISHIDYAEAENETKVFSVDINEVKRRLSLKYKNPTLSTIPVKVSVSELTHSKDADLYSFTSRPAFMSSGKMTAAQKGTATHTLMQFADYKSFLDNPDAEIQRLINGRYLSEDQANVIDTKLIFNCLNSSEMRKFLSAEKTFREYRFTVKIKASEVFDTLQDADDNEIILQGAVDCAYVENGKIVVIDYKTDQVKTMEELKDRYETQLKLYSYALKLSTGLEVSRCVIYSFKLNDTIEC